MAVMEDACDFTYLQHLKAHKCAPFFTDQYNRCLLLHGVNVSGSSKLPSSNFPACLDPQEPSFWSTSARFVGRPFPLDEAEKHFTRLKFYGLTLIRFVLTWESIEVEAGVYDEAYLTYLESVLQIAEAVGLLVVIDCHQDCWSRFSGGSGAPLWTFEVAGLDPRLFVECGSSILHKPNLDDFSLPGTMWATNYTKFAVNTMFTLFFAGDVFAPKTTYKDENAGCFLRRHYIECFTEVARRLRNLKCIIGFDVMNEPHNGFIGLPTLQYFDSDVLLHLGDMPNALQSMRLAAGIPQEVPHYTQSWPVPSRHTSTSSVNPNGICAWLKGRKDIWLEHGVYFADGKHQDQYFSTFPAGHSRAGDLVNFNRDFYVPFLHEFDRAIKSVRADTWTFIEPIPNLDEDPLKTFHGQSHISFAPHWYDLQALFEKRWSSWMTMNVQQLSRGSRNFLRHTYFGRAAAVNNYAKQYSFLFKHSPVEFPRVVGETGVPFDMNNHYRKSRTRGEEGDYREQGEMMDVMCTALERNLLSYTLWNYTPSNKAYLGGGDLWNGEDFSIYSEIDAEHVKDEAIRNGPYAGARARQAWIRPNATKIAGVPIKSEFELRKRQYTLVFEPAQSSCALARQTEIFVPAMYLSMPERLEVTIKGIEATWHLLHETQTLVMSHAAITSAEQRGSQCTLTIKFGKEPKHNGMTMILTQGVFILIFFIVVTMISFIK